VISIQKPYPTITLIIGGQAYQFLLPEEEPKNNIIPPPCPRQRGKFFTWVYVRRKERKII